MRQTFRVEIDSPYGKQPIEQFAKHLSDMSSESLERWGITINIERVEESDETAAKDDFESQ